MRVIAAAALAVATLPTAAEAVQFRLTYTTQVDATSGPAATIDAILTTDNGSYYGGNGYRVLSATGTRTVQSVSQSISFDSTTLNDEIYVPGDASGTMSTASAWT